MSSDFGYINARLRAMKSYLLKKEEYENLLSKSDFTSFFLSLQNRPGYGENIREAQREFAGTKEALDRAFRNNLVRTYRKITKFCSGPPEQLILLILHRWDLYNLKVIIRGIINKVPVQKRLEAILNLGEWEQAFIVKLCELDSLTKLIELLRTGKGPWSSALGSQLSAWTKNSLREIENSLDIFYYRYCLSRLDRKNINDHQLYDFFQTEIDFRNILTLLAGTGKNIKVDQAGLIKGGKIPENILWPLRQMKSCEEILEKLSLLQYREILSKGLAEYREKKKLSSLEKFFKTRLFLWASKLFYKNPLNIGVALGYIQMKETELINLRTIATGLFYGMKPDFIRGELVPV